MHALRIRGVVLIRVPIIILSFEESKPTQPAEKLCIGVASADTQETQVRLLW
jgi:hypothetical protein